MKDSKMTEKDILEMQRRIDEGIRLAHKRLWNRAIAMQQSLIVSRDGIIQELIPEGSGVPISAVGDPLSRRKMR